MVQDAVGWLIPYDEIAALVTRPAQRGYRLLRLGQLYHFASGPGPYDWQFKQPIAGSFFSGNDPSVVLRWQRQ